MHRRQAMSTPPRFCDAFPLLVTARSVATRQSVGLPLG